MMDTSNSSRVFLPAKGPANAKKGADDRRMKLLLSLIESADIHSRSATGNMATASGVAATGSNSTASSNLSVASDSHLTANTVGDSNWAPMDARPNLVSPPLVPPPPLAAATKPSAAPLSKPPTLLSTAMFQMQHKNQAKGLKMPPPLPNAHNVPSNVALRSFNYNHTIPKAVFRQARTAPLATSKHTLATSKHTLAIPGNMFRRLSESSLTGESSKEASPSQLHTVCCWGADSRSDVAAIITSIVARDRMAIRRKCHIPRLSGSSKTTAVVTIKSPFRRAGGPRNQPYCFPLNLALLHQPRDKPDLKVLRLLAEVGPDVLRMDDGRNGGGSLIIALHHHPKNLEIVRLLLEANPNCVQVSDRRGNGPLHVACFHGAPLEIVEELYRRDPAAIDRANMCGETPWNIAQRNSLLSTSPVAEFLYACTKRREGRIRKTPTKISLPRTILKTK
ncbi:Ankyrin repeat-containing protein [Seminavis robusta]|uniref:Ankyrin repeat-containing protein n=1 Tax=Seminavis robusta TaxID=568900 RepID=A0A9N8HAB0_9STRA|nr:Ankyrin repeat-containing protein [Seminavis robusta]|eukprot:Sro312_g114650.1 Ankyrin repeat-containing protein (450) ;mRNA; r:48316-49665